MLLGRLLGVVSPRAGRCLFLCAVRWCRSRVLCRMPLPFASRLRRLSSSVLLAFAACSLPRISVRSEAVDWCRFAACRSPLVSLRFRSPVRSPVTACFPPLPFSRSPFAFVRFAAAGRRYHLYYFVAYSLYYFLLKSS
eukprot:Pompholyxophrys_punicea_v1_NODE_612_length_1597_cov_2.242542.p3 type:complete len:138 gc:universal NODE_612_length_1597_cov_2.242542:168-581(+)